jgi:hypothetical protein
MNRLLRGCIALVSQYGRWLVADGPGTALARIGGCTAAAALGVWTTVTTVPLLPVAALVVFTIAAAVAAGPGEQPDPDDDGAEDEEEELTAAEFIELAREACEGGKGVHLSVLAEQLDWDPADVREMAAAAGVPVTPSVRMKGAGVSTGIRLADLPPTPPLPLPDAEEGRSSAGQAATATTTPLDRVEIGEGCVILRDPAETARRHRDIRRTGAKQ